ncbi:MAG: PDZ domain-containing protein, partial [Saprospiraceae bacterium]|nr:PDZ domain-containing protein [Saprospiraceae bacterium]
TIGKSAFLNGRNGILGNGTLNRFSVILDYRDEKVWLKPNRNINRAFTYDRSGLQLLAYGLNLNQFNVQSVLPGSPAAEADIRPGDQVMRVGRLPASLFSLHDILKKLQKSPGTRIKIVVKRDGKRIRKTITLRDLV